MEAEITVHDGAGDERVRTFLDTEWLAVDPESWTSGKCVITAERNGQLIGAATCKISAGVAHLGELMVADTKRNNGIGARLLHAFEEWSRAHGATNSP